MTTASTAPKKKKAAPKKVTDEDVIRRLAVLQRTDISSEDRAAASRVIRLLS